MRVCALVLGLLTLFGAGVAHATTFPILDSLGDGGSLAWDLRGPATFTGPTGQGWLQLVPETEGVLGAAISDTAFDAGNGFSASFDYAMGGSRLSGALGFFLVDGSMPLSDWRLGHPLGGLGLRGCPADDTPGMPNVVLAVGLDEAGGWAGDPAALKSPGTCGMDDDGPGFADEPEDMAMSVGVRGGTGLQWIDGNVFWGPSGPFGQDAGPYQSTADAPSRVYVSVTQSGKLTVQVKSPDGRVTTFLRGYDLGNVPDTLRLGFTATTGGGPIPGHATTSQVRDLRISEKPLEMSVTGSDLTPDNGAGQEKTYAFVVSNDGSTDTGGAAPITANTPDLTNVTWTCAADGGATCTAASGAGPIDTSAAIPALGTVTYTIHGTAVAGWTAAESTMKVGAPPDRDLAQIDTGIGSIPAPPPHAPPGTRDDVAAGWANGPVTVTLTATPFAGRDVTSIKYLIGDDPADPSAPGSGALTYDPANKPVLQDGQRIRYYATDSDGNEEPPKLSARVKIDTIAPTVVDDVLGDWVPSHQLLLTATDNPGGSGIAAIKMLIGAAPGDPSDPANHPKTYNPFNRPFMKNGWRVRYVAVDNAGNESAVGTSTVQRVDAVVPFTKDDVTTQWRAAAVPASLESTDALSGVEGIKYTVGLNPPDPRTAKSAQWYRPDEKPVLNNRWKIYYAAVDVAGNWEYPKISNAARVDTNAPETVDNVPLTVVKTSAKIRLSSTDLESGVQRILYTTGKDPADPRDPSSHAQVYSDDNQPELKDGERIRYSAVDNVGNVEGPKLSTEIVTRARCKTSVTAGRFTMDVAEDGCILNRGTAQAPRWETFNDAIVDGVEIDPHARQSIVLVDSGGGARMQSAGADMKVQGFPVADGPIDWAASDGNDWTRVTTVEPSYGDKLGGLPVSGNAEVWLGQVDGMRTWRVQLNVEVPGFKTGPESGASAVTGHITVQANAKGVRITDGAVRVSDAYVGAVKVSNLCFSYTGPGVSGEDGKKCDTFEDLSGAPFLTCHEDMSAERWSGTVEVELPKDIEIGVSGGLSDGRLAYLAGKAAGLGVPIAPSVQLDGFALGVCVQPAPFKIKGSATINIGSLKGAARAKTRAGAKPAEQKFDTIGQVEGSLQYTDPFGTTPWQLEVKGNLKLFDKDVASGYLTLVGGRVFDFGGKFQLDFGPASVHGGLEGFLDTNSPIRFSVAGNLNGCVSNVCLGFSGAVSSRGVAACAELNAGVFTVSSGFSYIWDSRTLNVMFASCSVGDAKIASPAEARSARAAGSEDTRSFGVAAKQPLTVVQVHGVDAAPDLVLSGPDGRTITTPRGAPGKLVKGDYWMVKDEDQKTTSVMVFDPPAGDWQIAPQSGSRLTGDVLQGAYDPAPEVHARVRAKGASKVLSYRYVPSKTVAVKFMERGAGVMQPLRDPHERPCPASPGTPKGSICGEAPFRPQAGVDGTRTVEVVAERDGIQISQKTIATYQAKDTAKIGRPSKLRAKRIRGGLLVAWNPATNAEGYDLVVNGSSGRHQLVSRGANCAIAFIRGVARKEAVTLKVTARSSLSGFYQRTSAKTRKLAANKIRIIPRGRLVARRACNPETGR